MNSMGTFYLIRHGQKLSELGDPGLTESGFEQARETGEYLTQFPITKIISSPFRRTTETANVIGEVLQSEPIFDEKLVERANWDQTKEKLTYHEFAADWIRATHDREYVMKIGDSSRQTGKRVEKVVHELDKPKQHIALVTHGGTIADYLRNVFGDSSIAALLKYYEGIGKDYEIMNCSITIVSFNPEPKLELLNYTDHLSEATE